MGSGFVVDANGFVVTAKHIFDSGGRPNVLVPGQATKRASIVASDRNLDIAVLKVNGGGLKALELGASGSLRQGDEIIVMGYPRVDALGAYDSTVTRGIVSSMRRDLIQIDAALNPGNSGGPVLNLRGEVVGVAVAKLREAVGINFAVPIDRLKPLLRTLIGQPVAQAPARPLPAPPAPMPTSAPARPSPPQLGPPSLFGRGNLNIYQDGRKVALNVEIAKTPEARAQGLMFRKSLPENGGMLFVFDEESSYGFWMKDTLIPLSIGFIDSRWHLLQILDMKVAPDPVNGPFDIYTPEVKYRYALEVNQGFFQRNGITPGARLELVIPK